jgi:addiction module RelE/StbE family toxin
MRIRWTTPARRALVRQISYIARDNPDAAVRVRDAIVEAVERLADQPYRGRPGHRAGTRELVIAAFPAYIVTYRVTDTEIRVIQVWHGRQDRTR